MDNEDDSIPDERTIVEQIALLGSQVYTGDIDRRRLVVSQITELCYKVGNRARAAVPVLLHCLSAPAEKIGDTAVWGLSCREPASIEQLIDTLGISET